MAAASRALFGSEKVLPAIVGLVQTSYGMKLDDGQFTIIYLNHWGSDKQIARGRNRSSYRVVPILRGTCDPAAD